MTDLVALTAELIGMPSVSHHEEGITDWLEGHLRDTAWLDVTRVGNNLVARMGKPLFEKSYKSG